MATDRWDAGNPNEGGTCGRTGPAIPGAGEDKDRGSEARPESSVFQGYVLIRDEHRKSARTAAVLAFLIPPAAYVYTLGLKGLIRFGLLVIPGGLATVLVSTTLGQYPELVGLGLAGLFVWDITRLVQLRNGEGKMEWKPWQLRRLNGQWRRGLFGLFAIVLVLEIPLLAVLAGRMEFLVQMSESMIPASRPGDLLVARVVPEDRLKIGDFIVYRTPMYGRPIAHRIIGINNGLYITKGDHNMFADPGTVAPKEGISLRQIQGKVIAVIPLLGYPRYLLSRLRE